MCACFTAWAMVDGGSNVKPRSSYNEQTPTIIVSRSHAGTVKQVAWQTFGNKSVIISAGGSGLSSLLLFISRSHIKKRPLSKGIRVSEKQEQSC